jgi:hypothetical protein
MDNRQAGGFPDRVGILLDIIKNKRIHQIAIVRREKLVPSKIGD